MKASNDSLFQAIQKAAAARTHKLAYRLSLSSEDRQDLQQELVLDMLEHAGQFDPDRGSAGTFTGVLSAHRASELMDHIIKDRTRFAFGFGGIARNEPEFQADFAVEAGNVVPMWGEDSDLFSDLDALHDLEAALAYMTGEQTSLFDLLASHQDLPAAARASGMSRASFYRRVSDLQMHLRMFGIKTAA